MTNPDSTEDPEAVLARLGTPIRAFGPSAGQTLAGIVVGLVAVVGGATAAAAWDGLGPNNRVMLGLVSAAGVVLIWQVWRFRKWRLAVYTGGLVQVRPSGVQVVEWARVTEVVALQYRTLSGPRTTRVDLHTDGRPVRINPINTRAREQALSAVLAAAEANGVPVRIEWQD